MSERWLIMVDDGGRMLRMIVLMERGNMRVLWGYYEGNIVVLLMGKGGAGNSTLRWEMPRKVLSLVHTEKHALQKGTPMWDEKLSWWQVITNISKDDRWSKSQEVRCQMTRFVELVGGCIMVLWNTPSLLPSPTTTTTTTTTTTYRLPWARLDDNLLHSVLHK